MAGRNLFDRWLMRIKLLIFLQKPRTLREVYTSLGYASKETARTLLKNLMRDGYVKEVGLRYISTYYVFRKQLPVSFLDVIRREAIIYYKTERWYVYVSRDYRMYLSNDKAFIKNHEETFFAFWKEGWHHVIAYILKPRDDNILHSNANRQSKNSGFQNQ